MSILCAIIGLLQLVILLTLTGVLVSIAAVSRLMEVTITFVHPITLFLLRQSGKLIIFEAILTDLKTKFPCLQHIERQQYAPYLNTAAAVLLGWLIVSWISYIFWVLLAPLSIAIAAIIIICPTMTTWCQKQTTPGLQICFDQLTEKLQTVFSQLRS